MENYTWKIFGAKGSENPSLILTCKRDGFDPVIGETLEDIFSEAKKITFEKKYNTFWAEIEYD